MNSKKLLILILGLLVIIVIFSSVCGVFVLQPIGAVPEGVTIIYWRDGLNMPFVASADGILEKTGTGVSLLSRGILLSKVIELIKPRIICRLPYSEQLYLISTNGNKYEG